MWLWVKRILAVAAILALCVLGWLVWQRNAGLFTEWMHRARPLPFFAVMTLAPAVGVPLTPFLIVAGATFGARIGLIGSGIALALNLIICYWLARKLRPFISSLMRRFGYQLPDVSARKRSAFRFTMALKLAPGVPAFVKNYGLGVAGVPFALYFVASMVITGVYVIAFVVLGESLLRHDRQRALIAGAALVAVAVGLWLVRRWRHGRRERHGQREALAH